MKTLLLACALVATLAACSKDSEPPPPPRASVSCADVRNPATRPSACAAAVKLELIPSAHAARTFERGNVSRAEPIQGELEIESPSAITAWIEARFDAGCGTSEPWVLMPKQPLALAAGTPVMLSAGGSCGDMPLGPRRLEVTAWQADGITVIDTAVVTVTLIE